MKIVQIRIFTTILIICFASTCEKNKNNFKNRKCFLKEGVISFSKFPQFLSDKDETSFSVNFHFKDYDLIKLTASGYKGNFIRNKKLELLGWEKCLKIINTLGIHKLPNQSQLKSDGIATADGVGYRVTYRSDELLDTLYYSNPDAHLRIEDHHLLHAFNILKERYIQEIDTKILLDFLKNSKKNKIK